jgi:starch synthase
MRICFIASEAVPFAKVGGLADVAGALPAALRRLGQDPLLIVPCHAGTDPAARSLARRLSPMPATLGGETLSFEVFEGRLGSGVDVVLLRQPALFDRESVYTDSPDEVRRFAFFCRAALELLARRDDAFDVVHVHDWQTATVPYHLGRRYRDRPALARARSVLTLHNLAFQGLVAPEALASLDIPLEDFHPGMAEFYGRANLLKLGLVSADRVTTVSPGYAAEILTPEGGHGLDGVLRSLPRPPTSILNGIDASAWNPGTDALLPHRFDAEAPEGRFGCKMALQQRLGLPVRPAATLAAVVARITPQKGLDRVVEAAPQLLPLDVQLVIVGRGTEEDVAPLERLAREEPDRVRLVDGGDEAMARLAYAGSDVFLAPSRFEPCGLSPLIAMRYGSVPVVHRTGGLADSVVDVDSAGETGTGFVFDEPSAAGLVSAVRRAVGLRRDRAAWESLVDRIMRRDVSWDVPARRYLALYEELVG